MSKRKRLIWHIFPPYLLITLISLFAVSWYASGSLRNFFLDQAAADLHVRAELLKKQIIKYLQPLDAASVDFFCKDTGKYAATRITVILPSGKVIGDSQESPDKMDNHASRPEISQALTGTIGRSIRFSNTLQKRMMYVAIPLENSRKIVAIIRTSLPLTSLDKEIQSIQIKIALGGFVIALMAAGISLIISRRISRPIEEMKKGADHFARGDLSLRLTAPGSEEMAGLAEAMNQMASQLDDRIKTVIRQRNELETVLASMLEGVIAVDNDERIISMNQAAARLFNCDSIRSQGRSIQEVIRNIGLQRFVGKALRSREPIENDFTIFQNGERILNVTSSPLLDANQESIGTLLVFNDVTRIRRLENMRRDFVANVSHEIKTPLTAIKGFVETLHQGRVDQPEEAKRFLGIIEKHVDRLNSIIEDLLSLSKIEQEDERRAITFKTGHLKDVFQAAIQICRPKAEEKNIRIHLDCEEDITARFDPTLLEQAVVNLLDNAIKYSENAKSVHIKASRNGSNVIISIQDHGIGIARNHLPRLFERFYRVDKARSRKMGGTGLGLAIVKHIVQAHDGHISVESEVGKGSTFTIHLPRNT